MYVEKNTVAPHADRLHALEAARLRLLDTMLVLRCDCADAFSDPGRTESERDGAALELAQVVGQIRRCDDELHLLREQARDALAAAPAVPQGWFG